MASALPTAPERVRRPPPRRTSPDRRGARSHCPLCGSLPKRGARSADRERGGAQGSTTEAVQAGRIARDPVLRRGRPAGERGFRKAPTSHHLPLTLSQSPRALTRAESKGERPRRPDRARARGGSALALRLRPAKSSRAPAQGERFGGGGFPTVLQKPTPVRPSPRRRLQTSPQHLPQRLLHALPSPRVATASTPQGHTSHSETYHLRSMLFIPTLAITREAYALTDFLS